MGCVREKLPDVLENLTYYDFYKTIALTIFAVILNVAGQIEMDNLIAVLMVAFCLIGLLLLLACTTSRKTEIMSYPDSLSILAYGLLKFIYSSIFIVIVLYNLYCPSTKESPDVLQSCSISKSSPIWFYLVFIFDFTELFTVGIIFYFYFLAT